jgi:hypothetical protein
MSDAYKKLEPKSTSTSLLQHLLDSKEKYNITNKDINSIMSEILFAGIDTVWFFFRSHLNLNILS